jgi:hypothetical protein
VAPFHHVQPFLQFASPTRPPDAPATETTQEHYCLAIGVRDAAGALQAAARLGEIARLQD